MGYGRNLPPMKTRRGALSQPKTRRASAPVDTVKPHPDVWKMAIKLANGDKRRLEICRDGAVVVKNP